MGGLPRRLAYSAPSAALAAPAAPPQAFQTFSASSWEGQPIEPRRWVVKDRIPVGEPGVFSGDGGTGKTKLALQLCVPVAAGLPDWIGGVVETHGPVIFYSAEEKLKEMHRRVADILDHRQLSFSDLKDRLHFVDPDDVVLGKIDRDGIVKPTLSLQRLEKTVEVIRPVLVVIENAGDVFAGNENDRAQVHRFVRSLLGGLTRPSNAAVMLIQHPSVTGLADGTGRSGSTGWNNAGRWRLNFTKVKSVDDEVDSGIRQLEMVKSNYGPTGEKVKVRWERGVFVPDGAFASRDRASEEMRIDAAFMKCLEVSLANHNSVSPHKGKSYAPSRFENMPEAAGINSTAFASAMGRLQRTGKIVIKSEGPPTKRVDRIVPAQGR